MHSIWWPGAYSEAWKYQNTIVETRRKNGIFLGFFRRLHTKNHRKLTLFWKVSCKKPKIGTLVTTKFGGGQYRSSIGICRGPGEPANTGLKHKASKKASSVSNKQKPNEAPKAKQACKRAHVNSEDAESSDEDAGHAEDQADAYERLRLEHETDRPVCGEINYLLVIANKPFQVKKSTVCGNNSCTNDIHPVFTPDEHTMSDNTIDKGHWCEVCK